MVVTLFVAGMFLDLTPAILIAAPLFLPLLTAAGFDPVQVGIIMIINLQLGGVTPPVGILVFITAQISRTSPQAVFREVIPFALAIVFVLALVCAIPALTLGLWSVLGQDFGAGGYARPRHAAKSGSRAPDCPGVLTMSGR